MLPLAERRGQDLALGDGTPSRDRSWQELDDRVRRCARWLRDEVGLAPGDHAAFLMHNRVEATELCLGAMAAGIWLTPINWHLQRDEIAYIIEDSGARLLVCDDAHEELARASSSPEGCAVCPVGDDLERAWASASDAPSSPDDPAGGTMIYTSGTTGRPKGVKRQRPATLGLALEAGRASGRAVGLDGSGPHLVTGPMYHAAPLMFAVYDLLCGAPMRILPRWDERACLEALVQQEIVHTHLVPTMFVRLLRLPETERAAFRAEALRCVLHGAAPIAPSVKHAMIEWWGPVLVEYWGATEGGVNTLIDSTEWLAHPGSVGRTLPAFEVFAVDEERKPLPRGETGALYCRHKHQERVFEYHADPEKTAAAYLEPGVFTIGDIGWVDDEGYVHLADRASHTIISGGVNVYPAEIERVLQEHPAVADVGVFGVPDDEWGECVKAAIELCPEERAGPELEASILDFARERLARYKVPRTIDFEERLPREASGKLYIRRLRDPYWIGRERRIG